MNSRRHTITSLSIVLLAVTIMSVSGLGQNAYAGGAGMSLSHVLVHRYDPVLELRSFYLASFKPSTIISIMDKNEQHKQKKPVLG